jgi:hypothetical protein
MSSVKISTNWIRDIYYDPCDPNPWVLVELAFPALIQAIWEYIQWDWEDYIQHGTGKTWQKRAKTKLKANKWQPPSAMSRGVLFLFLVEAGVQRLGWMFMVAEIIANAFIRWASLVMSLPACNETITSTWGRSESPIDGRPLSWEWSPGSTFVCEEGTMFPYIHPRWTVPPGGSAYYTTFQRYANFFSGAELKVRTRIVRTRDGYPINETPWNDPSKPTERSSALHGKIRNTADLPEEFEFQVQLADSEFPLVWHCIGDFVSVRIFEPHQQMPQLGMPYIPLDQPKRRTAQPRKQKHPS